MAKPITASLVARIPKASGAPTLSEVDRLVFSTVAYTDELNRPGTATLTCPTRSLTSEAKGRLRNLAATPSEVWIYAGDRVAWAGEIRTRAMQGQNLTLNCVGLLGYLERMGIVADYSQVAYDQFAVVKDLVDAWQGLSYGHYGIDTSAIGASGVVRTVAYLRKELNQVGAKVLELGALDNGFDLRVDPATRRLIPASPRQGSDLSASVFMDYRNIDSSATSASVAPADLISDLAGTGTSQNASGVSASFYSTQANTVLRAAFGRTWGGNNFQNSPTQSSLDASTLAYLNERGVQLFQPGVTIRPRVGADIGDFGAGDTVAYAFDSGLGMESGSFRVLKVTTNADDNGNQTLGVDFA